MINKFRNLFSSSTAFYVFLLSTVSISFLFGFITFYLENGAGNTHFTSFVDFLYWWFAMLTTIGNTGEPITQLGKITSIFTMLSGSFVYLGIFSEIIFIIKRVTDEKIHGLSMFRGKDHILILGYNSFAISLINHLDSFIRPGIDIVLVTNSIDTNPDADRISFIKQNPLSKSTLHKSCASFASVVFILSPNDTPSVHSDTNSLLIAESIEKIDSNVFTFVEVNTKQKKGQYKNMSIDAEFSFEDLLENARNNPTVSTILNNLPVELKEKIVKQEYLKR